MKNSQYWEERIANNTWTVYNSLEEKNKALMEMYQEATLDIQNELYTIAQKINGGKSVTLSDMHKYNRLNSLQSNIEKRIEQLGEETEKFGKENMKEGFKEVYSNARQELGGTSFSIPNERLMEQMMNTPWQGSNFSKRLWKNTGVLARNLNEILTIGLTQGKTITEMAIQLSNRMNQSFNAAHKLIRTETIHYLNESAFKAYQDGGCEEVEVWAAKDERTCDVCGKKHGKKYKIDKRPVLPFHPNCRCTYLPVVDIKKKKDDNTIARPNINKNILRNIDNEIQKSLDEGINIFSKFYRNIFKDMSDIRYNGRTKNSYACNKLSLKNGKIEQWVELSSIMKTKETVEKYITNDLRYNYHYEGTTPTSIIVHELTHKLNYQLAIKNLKIDVNNCKVSEWDDMVREADKLARDIKEKALLELGVDPKSKEAFEKLIPLGKYAFKNDKEFLAEALSEGLCVGKTEIGKVVIKIVKEML